MNKTELVNAVVEKTGMPKVNAKAAVDATLESVVDALIKGEKVSIIGFGAFAIAEKAARSGFNPRTKEVIEIPARKTIKFKPGAELAEKIK